MQSKIDFAPTRDTGNRKRPMLRRPDAAAYLGVSANYLAKLAVYGTGPAFIKLGGTVVYDPDDIDHWIAARRVQSTSEYRNRTLHD